jgi:alkylation response protein AidB-like acyl-CoA dehydrogenase
MPDHLETLDRVVSDVVGPAAAEVDRAGAFPRAGVSALAEAGLLGLVSATEVGGGGQRLRAAVGVVERLARTCASTAMVTCMHYAAAAVLEAHGDDDVRRAVARGAHLSTLAFSEAGSRSHFWAPLSTAQRGGDGAGYRLHAHKSWVTAAGEADSYVWSSLPVAAEGASTIWLVPAGAPGLKVAGGFDGLGLRGNASSPVLADGVTVGPEAMLGPDGGGFDVMMGIVLPWFALMSAASCAGIMEAATAATAGHVSGARLAHQDQALADLPTIRAYVARMRILTDQVQALLADTLDALERQREDAQLRVLEVKAAAGEAATQVTDLAMRVCGGAAFRRDVGVERNFRDARAATVMAPTTDVLYDFVGRAVCGLPLF